MADLNAFDRAVQAVLDSPQKEYTHEEAVSTLQHYGILNDDGTLAKGWDQVFVFKEGKNAHQITNSNKFRAMTDEEMAKFFKVHCCPYVLSGETKWECTANCERCWLDWLKAPANERGFCHEARKN